MTAIKLLLRATPSVLLVLLTSCASLPPKSPPSSSAVVIDTSAAVKAEACAALKPEQMTEAEANASPMLLNYGARAAARWLAFGCGA